TAALIGLPASQHPDGAFMSAMTRVAEIVVGIVSAGVVSALVFPQYTGEQMRTTVRKRFGSFVDYVAAALSGQLERAHIESVHTRFVADVVGFEAARSMAVFENPDTRMRSGRLARLNSEFMSASSRFHALHQLMNRLRTAGAQAAIDALEPYFREIAPLLTRNGEPVRTSADSA
ncbi:FUSC family protein, partial [Burkholderia multivorans]